MNDDMRSYQIGSDVANQVRMLRLNSPLKTYLLVEGATDARFFKRAINEKLVEIIPTQGVKNLLNALQKLNAESFKGVLAIADSDFILLEETPVLINNLLYTDSHDLETMLLQSAALETILAELGSAGKLAGKNVRDLLLKAGLPIGYLRWISSKSNWSLTFHEVVFSKFIDKNTLVNDITELIRTVKNKTDAVRRGAIDEKAIKIQIENFLKKTANDPWQICCGHDLIEILSLGLQKLLGSHDSKTVEIVVLERDLRIGYEAAYFQKTQLYAKMCEWEKANSPFYCFNAANP